MVDYRRLKVGQTILFTGTEPPDFKPFEVVCEVTEVHKDHAIAKGEGMTLWIDDDSADLFYTIEKNQDGKMVHKNVLAGRWN